MKLVLILISTFLFANYSVSEPCKISKPHPSFAIVLTNPKYDCYGKPAEPFKLKKCNYRNCSNPYYIQKFCKEGIVTTNFYHSDSDCLFSKTGYHDNLGIQITVPCVCDDGIDIGDDY